MCPNGDRSPPLLLSLAACLLVFTAAQCISPVGRVESPSPAFARTYAPVGFHTREEVADSAIDLARDARREFKHPMTRPEEPFRASRFDDVVEVALFQPKRIFHRRVSPPFPDCIC